MALAISRNWNDLPNISEVAPISEPDEQCLEEIRAVLEKYNRTTRFGVALLHKHFDMASDEILLERTDIQNRTLHTTAVGKESAEGLDVMTTIWRFDGGHKYGCSFCNKDHHT